MKLKALAALCKKSGEFRLYDRRNSNDELIEQWLGTGAAIYPLKGLPIMSQEHLIPLFELTEKQLVNIGIRHYEQMPEHINFEDTDPNEEVIGDRKDMAILYSGYMIIPVMTENGLELIDNYLLSPLSDVADNVELYERYTDSGQVYFAAKLGLMLVGVIMPLRLLEEPFVESVEALARRSRAALALKKAQEAQRAAADEQLTINERSEAE